MKVVWEPLQACYAGDAARGSVSSSKSPTYYVFILHINLKYVKKIKRHGFRLDAIVYPEVNLSHENRAPTTQLQTVRIPMDTCKARGHPLCPLQIEVLGDQAHDAPGLPTTVNEKSTGLRRSSMQGTIYRRVKHHCNGSPLWVRLPNPTPKAVTCSTCGRNIATEKELRYDASWWAGGKKRGRSFARKHDAQRHLATVIQEVHEGSWQPTRTKIMGGVFDEWLKHIDSKRHKGLLKPSTHLSYRGTLEQHLRPAFGSYRSDQLTAQVLEAWERKAAESSKPKTHNNRLGTLRVALAWAREQRYLKHDPMQGIRTRPCAED